MQSLAVGVGDLKRVLTNVKARGTWGEVQLERMLEQILSIPTNTIRTWRPRMAGDESSSPSSCRGGAMTRKRSFGCPSMPSSPSKITSGSKMPRKRAMPNLAEAAAKQLENSDQGLCGGHLRQVPEPAQDHGFRNLVPAHRGAICRSRSSPRPARTVFKRKYKVMVAGPTTLWSILNSLQMGFRTLAIQQRSSEVWNLLAAVKTEFGKYGEVLGKVQKKLQEATNTIDSAAVRTRAIEKKLLHIQELPAAEAQSVLMLEAVEGNGEGEGEL